MMLTARDDGPGVPEAGQKHILQAFTRQDRSRDLQTGCHGLGLAITKRIFVREDSVEHEDLLTA